jgi:DNA-binding SARP family transcriptional activator
VSVGGVRQKALLAVLVLNANEVVSTDRLIDELWGENAPASAVHTIQVFVSRLRRALQGAAKRLVTRQPGYVLELAIDELDAARYERLYDAARGALAGGDAAHAAELLREAQALWRGRPLVEFSYEPFAQATVARLEELRASCREELLEAELALGRHAEVISDLEALVLEQPLRERPRAQLMLALYRCGRQAEALETFRDGRRILVDELGLEPSPALRELEQAILRQDPSLEAASPTETSVAAPGHDTRTIRLPLPRALERVRNGPFVGREAEISRLLTWWTGSGDEARGPAVLSGEAGIGKTRLASELANAAHENAALVQ